MDMQTHDNSGHGLRETFLQALRDKADKMGAKGSSSITAGELNEESICEWQGSNKLHCRKMPDDEHGVLRISIGGGDHLPVTLNYCVVRGGIGQCIELLEKAIAALKQCPE
jgi:hypothetical protein